MATSRTQFRILGPLEVRVDGVAVAVGGPRQRALLALLLLSANRVVSRDRLINELFADRTGGSPDHALRVQISRLRKVLGPERLLTRPPGYLLRVEPGELDLHAFEQLLAEGRRALRENDPQSAAAKLRESESLWRGRPFADLEFEPFARVEIERLEELRLEAVEERLDAELALGHHGALASELEALVADHPHRERLRGQQMLALYRAGRQAEALEVYRAGRTLLVEELALEPSPRLKELEQAILRQDGALELTQGASTPLLVPLAYEPVSDPPVPVAATRRRRGLRPALLSLAAAALAAAVAIPLVVGGSLRRLGPVDGSALALVSSRGTLEAVLPLQAPPTDVATGFGSLWISEVNAGRVVRVDTKRRAVVETIPVGRGPGGIAAGAGDVWVVNTLNGTLSRIDPVSDTVAQTIQVGSEPSDVVVSRGSVWVASHGEGTVARIAPATGRIERVVRIGGGPSALAAADGTVWAANDRSGTLARIDARTGSVTDVIHVGDAPSVLAATRAGVWVLDRLDSTLSWVDAERDAVTATFALAGTPTGLAVADGALWVADEQGGTLSRLDPQSGAPTRTIRVGGRPQGLAAVGGLWTAVDAGGASHRGGTLRIIATNSVIDTIDPGGSTSHNLDPLVLLGMTNDGLVALDHVSGPDGTRLVPDLALSLPRPSDDGRTYAFRLRPGIRYSTGALLEPTDVRHSFERLFELHSSGASYFTAIAGAGACARAPAHCDLSRGIVTDDSADTVTFHLARPDPDFLYKLALTYSFVLPATIPGQEARSPLPATGPYMIVSYRPGREVRLARNPHFREWSAAAQPVGYPEQIVMRLGVTGAQGPELMARGGGDFMGQGGPIPRRLRPYFLVRHPSQVRINPALATNFLALNVNAPPFDDLRVRRALNYALDRRAIVRAYGGAVGAQPTCQVLPPQLPGYRPYCPYTTRPRPDGRWHGPDLARARRLVAASGTRGMKVAVWDTLTPQIFFTEGRLTVAALKQLGYRVSLRLLPDSVYFNYTNDSRNHAQVVDGGWSADYPAADNFIGKLTCSYFVAGNGPATTDASEVCNPAFDKRVGRAAALQATDPSNANLLWARLDRELTDRAVWLPTVTPKITDFVSRRVGNYQYNPVLGALVDQLWVR